MTISALPAQLAMQPIAQPLNAVVRVPGSKSVTLRALIIAALAPGRTGLRQALFSDDSRYCADALVKLGFHLELDAVAQTVVVEGQGGRLPAARAELYMGHSGTSARLMTALLALGQGEYVLDGSAQLRKRPLDDLLSALTQLGAHVHSDTGCPPVRVQASGLPGGRATVGGEVSSQFLSGLLLAAPYAQAPVELVVAGTLNSAPYVDLTLAVMADFGVTVEREGYTRFQVTPQRYQALPEYIIEGDASAASYFFAAPAVLGGSVRVANISRRARQGDVAFVDVLAQMGCRIEETDGGLTVSAPPDGQLRGVDVDMRHIPDTAQTLAAIAPFAESPTRIRGIASARRKETDRVSAPCTELRRLGVAVDEHADGLTIYPAAAITPATVQTYDDHRMAMAFALIGLRAPGVVIDNPGCVSKTFPDYFAVLETLRPV